MAQVSLEQALQMVLQHRRAGNPGQAEAICREILAQVPNHPPAMHQLAIVLATQRRGQEALPLMQQVVQMVPGDAAALSDLGNLLRDLDRPTEALAAYRRAVALNPNLAFAQSNLANQLRDMGQASEAVPIFHRAIQLQPNFFEAYLNLGNALMDLGETDQAVAAYQQAIRLNPNYAMAHCNLGVGLRAAGRVDDAIASFRRAIEMMPNCVEAYSNLGQVLASVQRTDEAIDSFKRAIQINPRFAAAYSNLGSALLDLRRIPESLDICRKAVALAPQMAEAHNNLANALGDNDQLDEAIAEYREALRLRPDYPQALANFGSTLIDAGRYDEARELLGNALKISPDFPDAHWNLGLLHLLQGDFQRGLPEYEWRWRVKTMQAPPSFSQPMWDGSPLDGKIILIHVEQGYGDAIQFARYVPMVTARGGRVILQCPPELHRLFSTIPDIDLFPGGPPPARFDVHCPILSLMLAFKTDLASIPAQVPYLRSDPALREAWRKRLESSAGQLKVGLAWAGRPTHINNRNRSIPLEKFSPLAGASGVDFFSLQKGDRGNDSPPAGLELIDHTAELNDFAETAALVDNLDLVITVDTAVAHLGGALGKPVWVLIPANPDWRWMLDRVDSPWYPTMRLYRRRRGADWSEVIRQVSGDLAGFGQVR
jgi:tetratricopeptide (TPR) repeat protein